jgi:excisionase family DNA binding protein
VDVVKPAHIDDVEPWFIRVRDVARLSGISEPRIRYAIRHGELPARQFNGRGWLIKPADARAWIESRLPEVAA